MIIVCSNSNNSLENTVLAGEGLTNLCKSDIFGCMGGQLPNLKLVNKDIEDFLHATSEENINH